jgi:methyl-accepting chemotaxis protein
MRYISNLKVSAKLSLLLLLFGLIPVATIMIAANYELEKMKHESFDSLEMLASETLDKVERNLFERYGDVQAFAMNTVAQNPENWKKPEEENPLVNVMNGYVEGYGVYKTMLLVGLEGDLLAMNTKDKSGKSLDKDIIFEMYTDTNFAKESWFKDVLKEEFLTKPGGLTGTVVEPEEYSDIVKDLYPKEDGFSIVFAAPVMDASGKVIAVWANFLEFEVVEEIVTSIYVGQKKHGYPNTEITLLDKTGDIIIDYDPTVTGSEVYDRMVKGVHNHNLANSGDEAASAVIAGKSGAMLSHSEKSYIQATGYAHSAGALGYPGLNWSLLIRVEEDQIFATIIETKQMMLLIMVVAIVSMLLIGVFLGRKVSKPLVLISQAMRDLAAGDYRVDLPKQDSQDEVGDIIRGLEVMKESTRLAIVNSNTISSVSSAVMIADEDNVIRYLNESAVDMMNNAEPDIKKDLPNFSVDALVGTNVDDFHVIPSHQRSMLSALKDM